MRATLVAIAALFTLYGCGGDDAGMIDAGPTTLTVSLADTVSRVEGNSGTSTGMVMVTLSEAWATEVTVDYASADGTALAPTDYTAASGTVTFPPGSTTRPIMLDVFGDRVDEDDETLTLTLSAPSGATLGTATSTVTITDDDAAPSLTVAPVTAPEGAAMGLQFVVTLSSASGRPVTVAYATTDGTAGAEDYTAATGALQFMPGELVKTVAVTIAGDALDELDETMLFELSTPVNAVIATAQATGTITDDDSPPVLAVVAAAALESGPLGFEVRLSGPSGKAIMVNYGTANGTATAVDYTTAMGTLMFLPGDVSKTVAVTVTDDAIDELNETVLLNLTAPVNASIGTAQGVGTILDDDASPTVSITPAVTVVEGNAGTTSAMVTVTLSFATAVPVTVDYASANGTAVAPADYTAATGNLVFAPGITTRVITVAVVGDRLDEADEELTLTLSAAQGATLGAATATVTITDDDSLPTLAVAPVTAGESAVMGLGFVVTLSAASGRLVTVDYATADGTARAEDYTSASGTLQFMPGELTKTVMVAITADVRDEPDETVLLALSAPVHATIATAQATGTITDDDPLPVLAVAPVAALEGAPLGLGFVVSLSPASGKSVTVTYATASGTATAADYTSAMGMLVFAPGEVSKTVAVVVTGDALDELDETVQLNLSAPVNATIGTAQAIGTILDDDLSPTVAIAATATLVEGNTGTTTGMVAVTLSEPTGLPVTVSYESIDDTAIALGDYTDPSGSLTFAPGTTTMVIALDVVGDTLDEDDETLTLRLTTAAGATLGDALSTVTIADDDVPPALAVAAVTAAEGSPRGLVFVVTLSAASSRPVEVAYATSGGTATAADYSGADGTVEFVPGETSRTVTVALTNDALDEPDETLELTLSAPVAATIVTDHATGTISDDDRTPSLSIEDATVTEDDVGQTAMSFLVTLSTPSGHDVSVLYGTTAGTGGAGNDYLTASGTLTLLAGETTGFIDVTINGDPAIEPDETFTMTLSGPTNATITAPATAVGTILDDDAALPTITIADASVDEGNAGPSGLDFTVSLSAPAEGSVTVAFATANNTATDGPGVGGGDYVPRSGTVTFDPGDLTRVITVEVVGDVHNEADETFRLNLSAPTNALLGDAQADGFIDDDDAVPTLTTAPVTVGEDLPTAVFTVALSAASGRTVTVDYATADGTALAGGHGVTGTQDYAPRTGTLTYLPGETSKTVAVTVNGDLLDEADETFSLNLGAAVDATVATASVDATVTDDDATPTVAVADLSRVEGTDTATVVTVPVTLSAASGRTVTVQFATNAAPAPAATAGTDYTAEAGTLTFLPGVTTQLVTVAVLADAVDEASERFVVDVSDPSNAAIDDAQGLVTLANDDSPLPSLSIGNTNVVEVAASATMTFTVTLATVAAAPVTVNFATTIGGTAAVGPDFTAASGMLTFAPGQTSKTITVTVPADLLDEGIETVLVSLSGHSVNCNLLDAVGQGHIVDNDATPTLSAANVMLAEGSGVITTATFTVALSAASGQTVTVMYATRDGTASAASGLGLDDYETRAGGLVFPPGTVSRTVTVPIAGDRILEPSETVLLDLSSPTNATVSTATATATISNDDVAPTLAITGMDVLEGAAGAVTPLGFAITMSAPSLVPVTVTFSTANGSATAGTDYGAVTSSVVLAPGLTAVNRTVAVFGDAAVEANETLTGRLTNPANATIMSGTVTATILNDD